MHEMPARKVQPLPFLGALFLAPLSVGLPAFGLIWLSALSQDPLVGLLMIAAFPAAATFVGAPTYLLFGGPSFWHALQRKASIPGAAVRANLLSLPFVALYFAFAGGDIVAALAFFAILGSLFAPLWGAIFACLYAQFTGEDAA